MSRTSGEYDIVAVAVFASDAELYHFLSQRLTKVAGIRKTYLAHLLRLMCRTFNNRTPPESVALPTDADTRYGLPRARYAGG